MLLTKTYKKISDLEEEKVRRNKHLQLSISELHLLETVGKYSGTGGATITELANDLGFTLPAVTIAIGGLEKKGYVCKSRDAEDKRSVHVRLTERGKKVDRVHKYIHKKLVREVAKAFNDEEMRVLIRGLEKVNEFFAELNARQ